MTFLLANWKLVVMGLLVAALGVQTLRLSWAENELISDKLAQADAVRKAQDRADALSTDLLIEQAKAYAVTEKKVTEYVDRIRTVAVAAECPADERDRLGSRGVRDILGRSDPKAK